MKRKSPYDITYCDNESCPYKDCENHWNHLEGLDPTRTVSFASFGGTCRRYISWLLHKQTHGKA